MSKTIRRQTSIKCPDNSALRRSTPSIVQNNQDQNTTDLIVDHLSRDPTSDAHNTQGTAGLKALVHALARKAARHYIASHPAKHADIIASEVGSRNHALARRK
jgi:hypothetical protein